MECNYHGPRLVFSREALKEAVIDFIASLLLIKNSMPVEFVSEGDLKMRKIKKHIDALGAVTIAPSNEPVIVQSKKVNNAAISIKFNKIIRKGAGGIEEERYLSRTYTFRGFKAHIPFKMAKQLVLDNPKDFTLLGPLNEDSDVLREKIAEFNAQIDKKIEWKEKRFICEVCGEEFVNQLVLGKHRKKVHTQKKTEVVKADEIITCQGRVAVVK